MDPRPDLLFADDGSVKLPKYVSLAISQAIARPARCLTRQPTLEKAEAVRDAIAAMVAKRGYGLEIRESESNGTWAVYIAQPLPVQ